MNWPDLDLLPMTNPEEIVISYFKSLLTRSDLRKPVLSYFFWGIISCSLLQAQVPFKDTLCIVAFGNSITAERNTVKQVFAQRLPQLLAAQGVPCRVINSGIGGSHTGRRIDHDLFKIAHALDRLESAVLDKNPDITIISFGTNDSYIDSKVRNGPSRIPLKDFTSNLEFIISSIQNSGSKIILMAPNCLGHAYPEFQNHRLARYVRVIRKLAKKYNTAFFNNYKFFKDYDSRRGQSMDDLMLDGVHPNDKGHEIMAGQLFKLILELI